MVYTIGLLGWTMFVVGGEVSMVIWYSGVKESIMYIGLLSLSLRLACWVYHYDWPVGFILFGVV